MDFVLDRYLRPLEKKIYIFIKWFDLLVDLQIEIGAEKTKRKIGF